VGLLLIIAGGLFALLFILNGIIQAIRKNERIGFVQTLLAFLIVMLPLVALVMNNLDENPLAVIPSVALGLAIAVIVLSLIVVLLELRRPDKLKQSRGLLGIGAGILVAVAAFSVPVIATYVLTVPATPTPLVVASAGDAESTSEVDSTRAVTPTRTPTVTLTPTQTPTRRPRPTVTPVATRFVFVTRTPLPTPTLPNPCLALANFNVNLRALPESDSEVLGTIPYSNTLTLFGRNDDSSWWYGEYEGQAGWVKGEFIAPSASCSTLPERAAD
jgi:hypothetical protein